MSYNPDQIECRNPGKNGHGHWIPFDATINSTQQFYDVVARCLRDLSSFNKYIVMSLDGTQFRYKQAEMIIPIKTATTDELLEEIKRRIK